jgi:regulator of protease activity HflC (stomatin/prohibitin superfamily)
MKHSDSYSGGVIFGILAFLLVAIIAIAMFVLPQYGVWQQSLEGKAELQKAEYTRQVAVLEAQAKLDSAEKLKEVSIKQAEGIAESNRIIGASLKDNPEYLTFLQIQHIAEGAEKGNKTYFVAPNQGGLPVLTAPAN